MGRRLYKSVVDTDGLLAHRNPGFGEEGASVSHGKPHTQTRDLREIVRSYELSGSLLNSNVMSS